MLGFQVLDGGQVLHFALEERSVLIGTAADCDVRLRAAGVGDHHARVEPLHRDGAVLYKLVDLGSASGTRVNGELVAQVALAVGDRIEVGGATLVLGKRVLRRTTPDEVLALSVRPRRRRAPEPAPRRPALAVILGGGVVLVALVVVLLRGGGRPSALARLPELLARGDHETAARILDDVRRDWVRGDAAREQVLAGYASELTRQVAAIEALEAEVTRNAAKLPVGQQIEELRRRQEAARDDVERAAVRRVLARLHDLRLAAPAPGPEERTEVAAAPVSPPAKKSAAQPGSSERTGPTASAPPQLAPVASAEERTQHVRQLLEQGALRRAADEIETLAAAEPATAASLRAELTAKAEASCRGYVAQAEELVALGHGGDARELLRSVCGDFPEPQRGELERQAAAFGAAVPPAPPEPEAVTAVVDPLGDLLRAVDAAEAAWAAGDFVAAEREFAGVAERVRSRDPAFAAELEGRSADCRMVAGLHQVVGSSLRTSAKPEVKLADDQSARLVDLDGSRLRFSAASGELIVTWLELPASAVDAILKRVDPPAPAYLGAAVLAMAAGDESAAEQRLLGAVRKDATAKPLADGLLARLRGEPVPASGYKIEGGKFTAPMASPLLRELEGKLGAALARGDRKARETVLADVLARGPDQLEAVISVLRGQQRTLVTRLQKHPFKGNWDRLAAERERLDRARTSALELIFDEVRYFYPYSPPAVSSEKATEYFAVQREVDARVGAVREIWEKCPLRFSIPEVIAADLERLRWVSEVLDGFGERSAGLLARARWVLALPDERTLDLQSFCRDPGEVAARRLALRIAKLNDKRVLSLNPAEREELELTNSYRIMMGRAPLAVDLRVLAAARGHCEEMERLGYFGHFSPLSEHRTPYDRMRGAGYGHGGSENIAATDSAVGAHMAWLHSSGHHRNILGVAHTEFACGQRGRLWTQNFGSGRDFEQELPE